MKKKVILADLKSSGFTNSKNWNQKQCADYLRGKYKCSGYLARHIAKEIINW